MSWWNFPVTQAHGVNGEAGVDIGTPFHTPITAPYAGTVVEADYKPWGGNLLISGNIPGLGAVTQWIIHLDDLAQGIVAGAKVQAGQVVGLSGGETPAMGYGDHPAQPQFSTGPHTEYGIHLGGATGTVIDPTSWLTGAPTSGQVNAMSSGVSTTPISLPDLNPADWVSTLIAALTSGLERVGFFTLALLIIIFGVVLVAWEPIKTTASEAAKGALLAA